MHRPLFSLACLVALAACAERGDLASPLVFEHKTGRAFTAAGVANRFLARLDFNGDGRDDLLVGGNNGGSPEPDPILVLLSQGDGSFVEASFEHLDGHLAAYFPVGVQADFNGDGIDDVAIFDAGNMERGQSPEGGFYGERPYLLLSQGGARWAVSDALERAIEAAPDEYCWRVCGSVIHVKSATAGDIDNDGDVDLYVESGGGHDNPNPHFMINQGDGRFVLDASDDRRSDSIVWGDTGSWRYAKHVLSDMDGDGFADLVMGQLRKTDNGQDALASKIVFNDGTGRFHRDAVVELPYAEWNDGYTYAKALAVADLDGDGRPDLVVSHQRANVSPDPDGVGNTGRFLQALIATDAGYEDRSETWFGNQAATVSAFVDPYGSNFNTPEDLELIDLNLDGRLDLVMVGAGPIGPHAPYAYLGTDDGRFEALSAAAITRSDWFGEVAMPIDLDGDGVVDLVHSDLQDGSDGEFGTDDDHSRIVPTLVRLR